MPYESIVLTREKTIATIVMNRPAKMNTLSDGLLIDLQAAFAELESDTAIRAVILTGSGRAFCAGFDISPRTPPFSTVDDWREHVKLGNDTCMKIWNSRLPFIAAVNGFCLGGGCDLSMVCDITLAAESAEFGEPEIQFQSSPPFAIMPWVLPMKRTKELLLTGSRISAAQAERIDLVNRVVADAELLTEARKLALQLSKIPPPAMRLNKRGINHAYEIRGFLSAIEYGGEMFTLIQLSESEEGKAFFAVAAEKGLKAAFKWRDERFALDSES